MFEQSDLSSLATLDALLQEGSVSKAARRLGLSTPAVSHALAKLRDRFADPLLVRAGRGMVLTPRAEALKPVVRDAMATAARVFADDREFSAEKMQRRLTLSVTDYVLLIFGAALDQALSAGAPGLDLRFIPNAVDDAERLRTGENDLAIGIYGELPPELKTRPIITDRLICVVRRDHPVLRRRLTLEQFVALEHIQVAPRGRPGGYVDELLAARGMARRVARAVPYFQVALELVAGSERILTVSERIARKLAPGLGLVLLEPPLPLEPFALSMVWHPRFDADPGHAWLRERMLEVTAAMDAVAHAKPRRRLSRRDPNS
ncbi:MAG: LysR family transcriptional regulator [Myxococcales bacterium]|nr:LysR family transcriptional regulator [Myxococcales bacterium]